VTTLRGWASDVALGVRLAVGGGRTALTRLALSSIGIGLAVAVLLVMASIGTIDENRSDRRFSMLPNTQPVEGVSPTHFQNSYNEFRGQQIEMNFVRGTAPDSPKPDGLPTLPKEGEMYASPALAELLGSDEGELLRPRFPEKIVGTLDQSLVQMPGDLVAWIGADKTLESDGNGYFGAAYSFGWDQPASDLDLTLLTMLLIGAVVVLLPLFIFVSSASRIAGAERDRRLSALRLVGGGSRQVRRIATAESLVSAVIGLLLGTGVFLVARQFAEEISVVGERAYVSDVVPAPFLVVVIVVLVPAVAVLTALFALRRTIIEPLGVVRQSKPVRRRAWWRFGLIAAGIVLMTTQLGMERGDEPWAYAVSGGAALLLIGVPVLLPWLLERVVSRVKGGPPSWMLAIRRLQLDSGTSARVVGGVAVVLAGTIALQTVLLSMEGGLRLPGANTGGDQPSTVEISTGPMESEAILDAVVKADGVRSAQMVRQASGYEPGSNDRSYGVAVLDCAAMRELVGVRDCKDGDVFELPEGYMPNPIPAPGTALEFREYQNTVDGTWDENNYEVTGTWTMPAGAKKITPRGPTYAMVLVTPGALNGEPVPGDSASVVAQVGKDLTPDQLEGIRNAVADYRWNAWISPYNVGPALTTAQQAFLTIRNALFAAALFTLFVACVSLLVLAVEHIRERRRPLAVLAASGVPTGVLGRSLLWQMVLPIVLGVVVALVTGLGLAAIVMDLTEEALILDWSGVALMCAGATVMTLLVSALTLPFLKRATRLNTIRTE
jgi:ABC-type lipoprotein release transport system permease subunit